MISERIIYITLGVIQNTGFFPNANRNAIRQDIKLLKYRRELIKLDTRDTMEYTEINITANKIFQPDINE